MGHPRGGADEAEIGGQPVLEDFMDMARHIGIFAVVIGTLQEYLAVLKHLEQLVDLDMVQLPDLIDKENPAVGLGHGAGLGLGDPGHAQGAGPLVDRIVDGADEGVGDPPFVKAGGGGIQLDKDSVFFKGAQRIFLGIIQDQPRGRRFPDPRRSVEDHMLGVGPA